MDIFQGKIHRYLILTGVTYAALSFFAASSPRDVVQAPQDNKQGVGSTIPEEGPPNKLEKEFLKKQQKPREQPKDKYGPEWQKEIREKYGTEFA